MKVYIKSSESSKDFDVFMLMQYVPDSGENGMEGDDFYCYGKFFADNIDLAKKEFESAIRNYPEAKFEGFYVGEYNPYFDDGSENVYGMPEVYPNVTELLETIGDGDYYNYDLPFDI